MNGPKSFELAVDADEQERALLIKADVDRGLEFLEKFRADPAILAFKLAIEKSPAGSPVQDIIKHNLLTAYRMRISQLLDAGEPLTVNRYLPEVGELALSSELAQDPEFRGKFADLFRNISLDFYNARQHEVALFIIRKALSIERCPSYYIDVTNARAWLKTPAPLSDYTAAYTEKELGRHIFVTCSPKSGSTFLKNVLVGVTGYKDMFSVYASLQNEHELDLPHFVKFGNMDTVTQQHARASEPNIQMMQAFGVRPTVLVRDIFDTTASLLDFYSKGFAFSTFFDKEDFNSFSNDEKIDILIKYALPWYFQFVASWQRAEKDRRLEMKWVTFEQIVSNKSGAIADILSFYGISAPNEFIEQKIAENEEKRDTNRFNKGIVGRGKAVLSETQRDHIKELAKAFPSADFGIIGV